MCLGQEKSQYIDDDGNVIKMPGADYADSLPWNGLAQDLSTLLGPQLDFNTSKSAATIMTRMIWLLLEV